MLILRHTPLLCGPVFFSPAKLMVIYHIVVYYMLINITHCCHFTYGHQVSLPNMTELMKEMRVQRSGMCPSLWI